MKSAKELLAILRQTDETAKIEAKDCTQKVDRSFMETVCAMTNEPDLGGGHIIVGLKSDNSKPLSDRYTVTNVDDPDKIKSEIVTNCSSMFNHRINVKIDTQQLDGKTVLVVEVPEGKTELKPYFFKNIGLPRGAYRRGSASDLEGTVEDMQLYYSGQKDFDKGIIEEASLEDIDDVALTRYRELRAKVNPHAEELNYNDRDLLEALGCIKRNKHKEWKLTYTGLLVFGKAMALRRIMPMVRADYIRVPGNEWVEDPEHRFETIDMRSPMILLVNRIFNAIIDDLPRSFSLQDGDIQASNSIKLPEKALREAIVNALIHRSYTVHRPIQIIRYSNRIEIINPGYSLKPEESLGEPGSVLRNPMISQIFHETDLAETKGSGLSVMRKLMSKAGLLPPTYESEHGKNIFTIRLLLHHLFGAEDMSWLENFSKFGLSSNIKTALVFLREVGAIDINAYRQLVGMKKTAAKADIGRLFNLQLIELKGHGANSYYVASDKCIGLFAIEGNNPSEKGCNHSEKGCNHSEKGCNPSKKGCNHSPEQFDWIPDELRDRIDTLGRWSKKETLFDIVVELCTIQPLSMEEIALILHRALAYTRNKIINPLKKEGRLAFTHPEMVNHPEQKYKVGLNEHRPLHNECTSQS